MGAIMLPLTASAQTTTTRRVYRNGRLQRVQVRRTTTNRRTYPYTTRNSRGTVTPQEHRRLARESRRYNRLVRRTTRDGVLTRREARKINHRARKYNRDTRRVRNN